jgi:hypothetical protein
MYSSSRVKSIALVLTSVMVWNLLPKPLDAQQAKSLDSDCRIHLATLSDEIPLGSFSFPAHAAPSAAEQLTHKPLSPTVSMFINVPSDAGEYEKVYQEAPTAPQLNELNSAQATLKAQFPGANTSTTKATVENAIAQAPGSFVLFVGHNDNGNYRFRNGDKMPISEIAGLSTKYGKVAIFDLCSAKPYLGAAVAAATQTELPLNQGFQIAQELEKVFKGRNGDAITPSEVQDVLTSIENKTGAKYDVLYVAKRGCGALAGLIILGVLICLVDDTKCPVN